MPIKNKHTTTTASVRQKKNPSDYYTVTDSFDEPLVRIHKKELENRLKKFIDYLKECGYVLDEVTATPIRDHQVFHQQSFDLIFSDPATLGITFAAMLISSGLIAAKVYNKNTATSFHEVIRNLNNEVGAKFAKEFFEGVEGEEESEAFKVQSKKLIEALENDLLYQEHNFNVKPVLVKKQDGNKYHYDVEYVLSDHFSKFLGNGVSEKVKTNKIYTKLEKAELEEKLSDHASEYTKVSKGVIKPNKKKSIFNFKSVFGSKKEYIPVSVALPEERPKCFKDFTLADVLQESFDFDKKGDVQTLDWLESFLNDNLSSELMIRIGMEDDEEINFNPLSSYERIKYKLNVLCKKLVKLSKGDLEGFGIEKAKNIMALVKLLPLFFGKKGEFDEDLTINQSRVNFLKNLQEFDPKKAALNGVNFADEISFNYWCLFIFVDMAQANPDSCAWSVATLSAVLGATFAFSTARKTAEEINKAVNSPNPKKVADLTEQKGNAYYDDDLKHRQMLRLFTNEAHAVQSNEIKRERKAEFSAFVPEEVINFSKLRGDVKKENEFYQQRKLNNRIVFNEYLDRDNQEKIKAILDMEKAPAVNPGAGSAFLNQINSVSEHAALLREQFSEKQKVTKSVTAMGWAFRVGIMLSFIQWVVGVSIFGAAKLAGLFSAPGANAFATAVNAAFNLGWVGGVFGVGVFLVGMGIGAGIYAFKTSKELKEGREKLKKRFEDNEEKIKKLELMEAQNAKLRQLVKERFGDDKHTKMLQSSSDRDNRRVSTERTPIITALKEIGDNLRYAVNKLGQAVLVHRSVVFPVLGLLGMTGLTKLAIIGGVAGAIIGAIAPFTLPAIIVVLAISAIWMGITTYKYIKDKQYHAANRFLDGVENGTRKAQLETEQGLLLQRLNYNNVAQVNETLTNSISSEAPGLQTENGIAPAHTPNAGEMPQIQNTCSILSALKTKAASIASSFTNKPKKSVVQTESPVDHVTSVAQSVAETQPSEKSHKENRSSFWSNNFLNNLAELASVILGSVK